MDFALVALGDGKVVVVVVVGFFVHACAFFVVNITILPICARSHAVFPPLHDSVWPIFFFLSANVQEKGLPFPRQI